MAAFAVLHVVFAPKPWATPGIAFFADRQRVIMPGFLEIAEFATHLPLTDQIATLLPKYVMKGSFATSWHAVVSALCKNIEKVRLFMNVFVEKAKSIDAIEIHLERIRKMASHIGEDTDKSDDPFEFALADHLIDCSNTVFNAQMAKIGWI
jgi:polyhydroxyalkanoate synthesis regulator protein